MSDLTTLTTPTRLGGERFQVEIRDDWRQGRGAFGGLVLGTMVRAVEAFDASPERPLRTLTAELCGPVLPGPNTIQVERLRAGTGVSTVAARLERDGEVLAHAVAVLGRHRGADVDICTLPRPVMPPWQAVAPARLDLTFPAFVRFFEFRPVGPLPFSGSLEPLASGWIRPREPGPARDAAYVTCLADAWWPALLLQLTAPRPVATVAFTLDLLSGLEGLDPEAPLFHSARVVAARAGYFVELRELWGEDGRLVALNQQTVVLIK
jgi:acyl-CoA thioesterase